MRPNATATTLGAVLQLLREGGTAVPSTQDQALLTVAEGSPSLSIPLKLLKALLFSGHVVVGPDQVYRYRL